ncbi:MAG: hypothetical protein AAF702_33310 [Chloroflexota bacterium]
MKLMKLLYILLWPLLLTACLPVSGMAQQESHREELQSKTDSEQLAEPDTLRQAGGIRFFLTYVQETYTVWMEPTVTPADPNLTLSIQVTLKVPHGQEDERFALSNLQSGVQNVMWAQLSRIDAPLEAPNADYISIEAGYIGGDRGAFAWAEGTRVAAFSFQNSGSCPGAISLVQNVDPFIPAEGESNSASTNPGNYIRVVGLGDENAYVDGTLGAMSANCDLRSDVRIRSTMARRVRGLPGNLDYQIEMLWNTIHEIDLIGFNILRQIDSEEPQTINGTPIAARKSGQASGAAYQLIDEILVTESNIVYLLELLLVDGASIRHSFGPIMTNFTNLPMIAR